MQYLGEVLCIYLTAMQIKVFCGLMLKELATTSEKVQEISPDELLATEDKNHHSTEKAVIDSSFLSEQVELEFIYTSVEFRYN